MEPASKATKDTPSRVPHEARRGRVEQEGKPRNDKAVNRSAVPYVIVRAIAAANGSIGSSIGAETSGRDKKRLIIIRGYAVLYLG